jgi:hypothetical protein
MYQLYVIYIDPKFFKVNQLRDVWFTLNYRSVQNGPNSVFSRHVLKLINRKNNNQAQCNMHKVTFNCNTSQP